MKITPRNFVRLLLVTGIAGVGLFSIYVATLAPDRQETVLLGQARFAIDAPAGIRVLVRDIATREPIPGAEVSLSLANSKGVQIPLGAFKTGADGTLTDRVRLPEIAPGDYKLTVASHSAMGSDQIKRAVKIFNPVRLLVSSDKSTYQPGQTIRLRALITHGFAQKPAQGEPITVEVSDSKGNKVFRESKTSSRFGIASADFALARELNMGAYRVSAISGDATAEQSIEIKRYALPKFKVGVTTDKSYYLDGEVIHGSIEAAYFFGQPLGVATVKLTATISGEKPAEIGAASGVTDVAGKFAFSIPLPAHSAGMPQKDQDASIDLSADVADVAGSVERKSIALILSAHDLQITAFPEQGQFVPHVENQVFVLTNEPDGRPSPCEVTANGRTYKTDAQGVCMLNVVPLEQDSTLTISARDARGRSAEVTLRLDNRKSAPTTAAEAEARASNVKFSGDNDERPAPNLLLRPDKASYRAGATVRLTVLSPGDTKTVFVDLMRDHQTVLTRSVQLANHEGELAFDPGADLTGLLRIHAYTIDEAGLQTGVSRLIYVNPASELHIAATRDREVYRPGETAKLAFQVTDKDGRPAPSALGVNIVDESVSAFSESQPGSQGKVEAVILPLGIVGKRQDAQDAASTFSQQTFNAAQQALSSRFPLKIFSSPMRLLQNSDHHPLAAQAYLASLDRETDELSIDELAGNYLDSNFIQELRSIQGTPAIEHFRNNPQYAEAFRILDDPQGDYSLSAATGAKKKRDVKEYRREYFETLGSSLVFLFVTALVVSLMVAVMRGASRSEASAAALAKLSPEVQVLAATASRQHSWLSLLTALPFVYYPLASIACSILEPRSDHWLLEILIAGEVLVVLGGCVLLFRRASELHTLRLKRETMPLQWILIVFALQCVVSRLFIAALSKTNGDYFLALALPSVLTPWLVLAFSAIATSSMLLKHGLPKDAQSSGDVAFAFLITVVVFLLAGIALPVFSSVSVRGSQTKALSDLHQLDMARQLAAQDAAQTPARTAGSQPRLRKDFPETLLWQPELITDDEGRATLDVPLADSITTWRASFDAIALSGAMADTELPIRAYQDFFVEIELPESLTLGDSISVPAVCHNYRDAPLDVQVTLGDGDWFEASPENRARAVKLAAHEVRSVDFPITVTRVGMKLLRVTAQAGATGDAIEREVRIAPSGRRIERTENNFLRDTAALSFDLPASAIPDASSLTLKIYPSRFSEVVEGLDSIFHAPYGCFEQTSSATYPNVLALDYLKSTGRLMPETEAKARKFINDGYQRLLTFEVPGGGFELFGHPPASVWLTAYGVLEFSDMAHMHPVDDQMMQRTLAWLFARQNADGSWPDDSWGETARRRGSMTAYVAWSLAESGDKSPQLRKALGFLTRNRAGLESTYSKALAVNALLARDRNDPSGRALAAELADDAQHPDHNTTFWNSPGGSMCNSHGESLAVETTALAALALMKDGRWPESVRQALIWISRQKSRDSGWSTTQATILAMRALIAGSKAPLGQTPVSEIAVMLNGAEVETLHIDKNNSDLMQLVSLTDHTKTGENRIELRLKPAGELPYQISESYSLPGPAIELGSAPPALQIDLAYDRTRLAVGERIKCSVTAQNRTGNSIQTPMVILGIPPGFELETGALESLQAAGRIAMYEVRGDQVLLYLRELPASMPLQFDYFIRAKYPLHVQAPAASVYEYYAPEVRASSRPPELTVLPKP